MANKSTILFLCTNNSARSQIAEALVNHFYSKKYTAFSAGITPTRVNPNAKEVMKEIEIDISNSRSKSIEEFRNEAFDYVVTVCNDTKENCPFFPGRKLIYKSFKDPLVFKSNKEKTLKEFRKVRDEIKKWIEHYFG